MVVGYRFGLNPLVVIAGLFVIILGAFTVTYGLSINGLLYTNLMTQSIGITFIGAGIYIIASVFI
jgi:hypothetical protein